METDKKKLQHGPSCRRLQEALGVLANRLEKSGLCLSQNTKRHLGSWATS